MPTVRPGRMLLSLAVVSMLAACSTASPSAGSPTPAPVATPATPTSTPTAPVVEAPDAWLVVGRPGDDRLHVILAGTEEEMTSLPLGAPDKDWVKVVTTTSEGSTTRVEDLKAERAFMSLGGGLAIPGHWRLPSVGLDPVPAGTSADGSTIVLVEADDPARTATAAATTRFAIVDRSLEAEPRIVELPGVFEFDALAPNGSLLYVVEHLPAPPAGHYQVRTVETATGFLRPEVVVDKRDLGETMAGWPVAQARRTDGLVLTLYRGAEHPFIHALDSVESWAVCLDLPAAGVDDADAALDWGMVPAANGRDVLAVNATLGLAVEIDPIDLAVRRSVTFEPSAAHGIVLAKFGHQATGPVGRRVLAAPDGSAIYAAGPGGIVRLDPTDLTVSARFVEGAGVEAMAMTPDGGIMYALMASGGRIAKLDAVSGEVLGRVPGTGYDRLVAIVPY